MRTLIVLTVLGFICVVRLGAQTDTISGVINKYSRVLAIDHCNSALVVENPRWFKAGDRALLIQMKGALLNTADSSTFGQVVDNWSAGNYELCTIDAVDGQTVILRYKLVREYVVAGKVQLVRVPQYHNVYVEGSVEAGPWNGSTGGVVAMIATDTVRLRDDGVAISASGRGFRGGTGEPSDSTYHSQLAYRFSSDSHHGALKGEGVSEAASHYQAGRGRLANAGGGGNARSAGGGGGGNYGTGGRGGNQYRLFGDSAIGGLGGSSLTYSNAANRVYMGGGGGAGHESHDSATDGRSGGGIVFIRANVLDAHDGSVESEGNGDLDLPGQRGFRDGGGGGGSGGVILLDINYLPSDFILQVRGGKGRYVRSDTASSQCFGPGGGGGGGVVWMKDTTMLMTTFGREVYVAGGAAGQMATGPVSCAGSSNGATAGTDGAILTGLQVPEGTEPR